MTNADKIRSMTDKELKYFICNCLEKCPNGINHGGSCMVMLFGGCEKCMEEWLQSEVEDE